MIQELVTLSTLGIVRLLGALVLLSLGIALTLWRLKRRRNRAVVMALFLCLVALVPAALAIEIPPAGSVAQIQTTGSNAGLGIGDWWTQRDTAGSDKYHFFDISVPCTVPPGEIINVWLFDPESLNITGFPIPDLDEPQGVEDNTTFTLTDPSGGVIATTSYPPDASTDQQWVFFAAFTRGVAGCGRYRLTVTTSDDDENAWKLRVMPDDPDGDRGSGDEISLASMQTSFQHNGFGCQTFHFFVPDGTSSILLSNFDMDVPGICAVDLCTVLYTDPGGVVTTGTASDSTVWNNTTISLTHPPPGGDEISEPEAGWWRATFCLNNWNQYLFDPGVPFFHVKPLSPDMRVSKDDGTATFNPDGVLNYTITYANAGPGAALDAVLTDRLPISTTFVSCTPRPGESCGEIPPPGSGIVTFSLGTIAAGESGSVMLSVRVDPGVLTGTITNTVELDYTDIVFSDYPVMTATDVDSYTVSPPTPTPPPPAPPDDGEPSDGGVPPTSTPVPPTPVPPTPTVEVVTVARLPETGGFPGWFTVLLGVPIIIGAAGLLNLARLEMRGRRGHGKGD